MTRNISVLSLWAMLFALCFSAQAQQPKKVPRIAYFSAGSASSQASRLDVFRQGLQEFGYTQNKDIIIEQRYAEGKLDRVAALAAELVGLKLDVIVTGGPAATRSAKEATATIPIVMGFDYDPVGSGVVASLARPGGNIYGPVQPRPGDKRKAIGVVKGSASETFPSGCSWKFDRIGHWTVAQRGGARRSGVEGAASISGRTCSERYWDRI